MHEDGLIAFIVIGAGLGEYGGVSFVYGGLGDVVMGLAAVNVLQVLTPDSIDVQSMLHSCELESI